MSNKIGEAPRLMRTLEDWCGNLDRDDPRFNHIVLVTNEGPENTAVAMGSSNMVFYSAFCIDLGEFVGVVWLNPATARADRSVGIWHRESSWDVKMLSKVYVQEFKPDPGLQKMIDAGKEAK